jgi:hypothetical protein
MAAAGCGREAVPLPPPVQRPVSDGRDPGELGLFIRMGDPYADEYIVRDVTSEKTEWRWTFVRPELNLRVGDPAGLRFVMEFHIPPVTFRATGPLTVRCFVNRRPIGEMRCHKPGVYKFEKPVPEGWLQANSTVPVEAEVDRRFVSSDDGAELSFQLGAIGFVH